MSESENTSLVEGIILGVLGLQVLVAVVLVAVGVSRGTATALSRKVGLTNGASGVTIILDCFIVTAWIVSMLARVESLAWMVIVLRFASSVSTLAAAWAIQVPTQLPGEKSLQLEIDSINSEHHQTANRQVSSGISLQHGLLFACPILLILLVDMLARGLDTVTMVLCATIALHVLTTAFSLGRWRVHVICIMSALAERSAALTSRLKHLHLKMQNLISFARSKVTPRAAWTESANVGLSVPRRSMSLSSIRSLKSLTTEGAALRQSLLANHHELRCIHNLHVLHHLGVAGVLIVECVLVRFLSDRDLIDLVGGVAVLFSGSSLVCWLLSTFTAKSLQRVAPLLAQAVDTDVKTPIARQHVRRSSSESWISEPTLKRGILRQDSSSLSTPRTQPISPLVGSSIFALQHSTRSSSIPSEV